MNTEKALMKGDDPASLFALADLCEEEGRDAEALHHRAVAFYWKAMKDAIEGLPKPIPDRGGRTTIPLRERTREVLEHERDWVITVSVAVSQVTVTVRPRAPEPLHWEAGSGIDPQRQLITAYGRSYTLLRRCLADPLYLKKRATEMVRELFEEAP